MSKTLVLVRHGKAVSSMLADSDFERTLTPQGLAALKEAFPRSFSLLQVGEGESVQLWASPAVRALQTAQVVSDVTGCGPATECDSLWHQDMDEFCAEVDKVHDGVIIAVGHAPFMDRVCGQLSGSTVRFSTGGVAALRIEGRLREGASDKSPGHLLWFVQGPHV